MIPYPQSLATSHITHIGIGTGSKLLKVGVVGGESIETARLAAIRMIALNDGQNTESDKLTLMNYAKKVYGKFDTGQNPSAFNNFYAWEKGQNLIIYKRMYNEESLIDEEIFITNNEYDLKLGEFYNKIEEEEAELDEKTN